MNSCPYFSRCPLATEELLDENSDLVKEYLHTPGVLSDDDFGRSYKEKYCHNEFENCARHDLAQKIGVKHLPKNLLPNQQERAQKIIQRKI